VSGDKSDREYIAPYTKGVKGHILAADTSAEGSGAIIWRDVGDRIRQARTAKGLTQGALGVMIGDSSADTSFSTVSNYERKGEPILLSRIERIAEATGRSVRWLLFGDVVPMDVDAIIARAKAEAFEEAGRVMTEMRERTLQGGATLPMVIAHGDVETSEISNAAIEDVVSEIDRQDREEKGADSPAVPARSRRRGREGRGK
jgi:transcriptional regulator with XRE-family HTH domain